MENRVLRTQIQQNSSFVGTREKRDNKPYYRSNFIEIENAQNINVDRSI